MLDLKISRRVFIGTTAYLVSAPILAKVCNHLNNIENVIEDGQFFTAQELTILTDVAEIMIPATETVGATDAQVIPILDGLMITWAGSQTKAQYRSAIKQIQHLAQDTYGSEYKSLAENLRKRLIEQLDIRAFSNTESAMSVNYRRLKEMIFHIYYTSEPANPDFVLIPGGYRGCLTKDELLEIQQKGYL